MRAAGRNAGPQKCDREESCFGALTQNVHGRDVTKRNPLFTTLIRIELRKNSRIRSRMPAHGIA
ncbi:hypothetical protein RISK_005084 [Rhodopirellula islandica]|uniref:Uncharacterized protein n=1 Tax=Rhodopirellula islandica TaxID=595434 RepID=A0A0J1B893_RHOIS|nr:hypothetical protein RISK_005084 [Rhodopirellula islandica]